MKKLILTLALMINAAYAGLTSILIDNIASKAELVRVLGDKGVSGQDAEQVQAYVSNALKSLNTTNSQLTRESIAKIIESLPATGSDAALKRELQVILGKSEGKLSKSDLVKAVNNLIYLANRYGKKDSLLLTCASCGGSSLEAHGFKFAYQSPKDAVAQSVVSLTVPKDAKQLNSFISSTMERLNVGKWANATKELVKDGEEREFATFLALSQNGTREQKAYAKAVFEISRRPDGSISLLDSGNPHRLWKVITDPETTPEYLTSMTKLLSDVATDGKKEADKEVAFFRALDKNIAAEKDPAVRKQKVEARNQLAAKKCFFL